MRKWLSVQQLIAVTLALLPLSVFLFHSSELDIRWGPQWTFLHFLPYALFATSALLAQSLNQSRVVFVSMLSIFIFALYSNPNFWPSLEVTGIDLSTALPIIFFSSSILIFLSGESRYWSPKGIVRMVAVFLPALALWDIASSQFQFYLDLLKILPLYLSDRESFSGIIFAPPLIFTIVAVIRNERNAQPFLMNHALCFVPLLVAATHLFSQPIVVISFLAIGGLSLHGIVQMYWHRVYLDELTGIPNRRALEEKMYSVNPDFTIAMLDIDHFKKFNDKYGHQEGDNVLRFVAEHLYEHTEGRAFRYGGEEFTVIFEKIDIDDVVAILDNARAELAKRSFFIRKPEGGPKEEVKITISVGIASPEELHNTPKTVMEHADQALYTAKENGRDCVAVA